MEHGSGNCPFDLHTKDFDAIIIIVVIGAGPEWRLSAQKWPAERH